MYVEQKDGTSATEEQWNFGSDKVGINLEPLHLGEGIRVDNLERSLEDGEDQVLYVETDSGHWFAIALTGDSLNNYDPELALPMDETKPLLVQEAFEGGRLRHSEFISWWLPLETNMMEELVELVRSEERNTWTGSKEGLVWESRVPVFHPGSKRELVVTWTYRARRVS